jgi:hypothetical protein
LVIKTSLYYDARSENYQINNVKDISQGLGLGMILWCNEGTGNLWLRIGTVGGLL